MQVAAGQVGQYPSPQWQGFQYNVTTRGRLSDPDEFGNIIVKVNNGSESVTGPDEAVASRFVRIKDVARVELGSQTYDQWCEISGKPAATMAIFQLPGANALRGRRRGASGDGTNQAFVSRRARLHDPVRHDDFRP